LLHSSCFEKICHTVRNREFIMRLQPSTNIGTNFGSSSLKDVCFKENDCSIFSSALLALTGETETKTGEKFARIFLSVGKFFRRHHIHNFFGQINTVNWHQDKYSLFYVGLILSKYTMINVIFNFGTLRVWGTR
jgi:hypothetical protein